MNKTTAIATLVVATSAINTLSAKPNIIWIEVDDLKPNFMHKLGDGFGYTPNIDRLASMGVYFKNAVCQGPMCGPSRNSLLAGCYTHNLGFYRNGYMRLMPKGQWVFPRTLKQNGYQTAYIGKSHMRPPTENPKLSKNKALNFYGFEYANNTGERFMLWKFLDQGKDITNSPFIKHLIKREKYQQFLKDNDGYGHKSTMKDDIDYLDGFTMHTAINWLKEKRDKTRPFFMWYAFCLPHGPYDVPQRWYDKVKNLNIPPPKTNKFEEKIPLPLLVDNKPIKSLKAISKDRLGEAANVAFMDAMIGKLLDELKKEKILDNTVIFFFSDHSIFLGNHGRMHKGTVFQEPIRTSLIVCYPKLFPKDKIMEQPVELLDLIPTTFELAGIKYNNLKNGKSIIPLLEGKTSTIRKYAFTEIKGAQSAIDANYHYIICGEKEFLYDQKNDPNEMKNIASEFPEITARFRKATKEWLNTTKPMLPQKSF